MSSKGKNASKAKKGKAETKAEDVLQAVILADSFQSRFKPLTLDRPRCLLPLANTPLIEYTLEFLAMNGVQEVYIYCGNHVDQVEKYIAESRWAPNSLRSPFTTISFVRIIDARSTGDILRDLDKRGLIDGDFILVHGDLVSNISLEKALAAHKARRTENSANIMTVVLRTAGSVPHRSQAPAITPVFTVDTKTHRCLTYDEISATQETDNHHRLLLDYDLLGELSTDYQVRSDLIDPEIDICTPDVLALWSESFDYELPRKNFLQGVLKDWELNGKAIHAEILDSGYAARARNLSMYNAISRDIMGRWTFPFVPDCNLFPGQNYQADIRHGNVVELGAQIDATSKVSQSVVAGKTVVGPNAVVLGSFIGRGCRIGKGARIENSHVWDGTTIEEGAVILHSLVAGNGAKIGKNAALREGSLLSFGVCIGEGSVVPSDTVLALEKHTNGRKGDPAVVGSESNAAQYVDPEDEDLDEDDPALTLKTLVYRPRRDSLASISTIHSYESDSEFDDDESGDFKSHGSRQRLYSFTSDGSGSRQDTGFHGDAVQGLLDTLRGEGGDFDAAKLEFMGLRLSQNASDIAVRKAIATAFAYRAAELVEESGLEPTKAVEKALTGRPGSAKFLGDVGVGGSQMADQRDLSLALHRAFSSLRTVDVARRGVLLSATLQKLYDLDIIEEDAILAWWADEKSQSDDLAPVREKCKILVEWLQTAEEEDSEEEEEDESEDEDDEDEDE
ncbi:putative translation initiation factor eIF-2B subunit epsilon [Ceratocystis fimbriata CBS 114723]|uniref:Mannose-1-phosphate guanyltransferase n=1 Tax=Ceratocystis fimbriata CBS 114723 TaxID=1035309 RepID=A0A2C5WVS5_9PEZI|nr:putative translation initiation factor eIF-2B subunit epsilon [Ceratocystis fimbriata CBS 114723]